MLSHAVAGLSAAALAIGGVVAVHAASGDGAAYVSHADVPGIGTIEGALLPGTRVQAPARIPQARPLGKPGLRAMDIALDRAYEEAVPGDDHGPAGRREAVQRSLTSKIFLLAAATACLRPPPAALAVLDYVYVAPQRRPALQNVVTTQHAMRRWKRCDEIRIRIDDWKGVDVRGDRATAVLRGAQETRDGDGWSPRRHEWRAILRRSGGDWKIAALYADDLDYRD